MKRMFIPAKLEYDMTIPAKELKKLKGKIGIVTTIQHLHQIKDVQKQIPKSIIAGQILGCDVSVAEKIIKKVDSFLYVGGGFFHPIAVALETGKDVFTYHPVLKKVKKLEKKAIEEYQKKKQISLVKFLTAKKVGILVSTKPGQEHLKKAQKLAKRTDKEYYVFAFDTLNIIDLENFNFIDIWVDTACPRIADEKKNIIDAHDVFEALEMK